MLSIVLAAAAADFTFHHRNPHQFVARFQACFVDPHCDSVPPRRQTGTFPPSRSVAHTGHQAPVRGCCRPTVVDRFRRFKHDKCAAAFSTYQIDSGPFRDIVVPTCKPSRERSSPLSRRDPVSRRVVGPPNVQQTPEWPVAVRQSRVCPLRLRRHSPFYHDFAARIEQSMRIGAFTAPTLVIDTADLTAFVASSSPAHLGKPRAQPLLRFQAALASAEGYSPALALYARNHRQYNVPKVTRICTISGESL